MEQGMEQGLMLESCLEPQTERLIMRQWQPSDRDEFARLNTDPRVMQFFPELLDRQISDALAERIESLIEARGWGLWALEEKHSGRFIGFTGLHIPEAELPFNPCVEIGWRLIRDAWGRGYATEAATEALRIGFEALSLDEIVSFTTVTNLRSRAVMLRLGMQEDESAAFEHPAVPAGHVLRPHCLYRLSRQQWLDRER